MFSYNWHNLQPQSINEGPITSTVGDQPLHNRLAGTKNVPDSLPNDQVQSKWHLIVTRGSNGRWL